MAKRTPEEILAQREAWLARKAAKEAGQEVPAEAPPKSDDAPKGETAEAEAPQPVAKAKTEPEQPKQKRTPEEIKAQREAFLAARAAKAAGKVPEEPAAAPTSPPSGKTAVAEKPAPAAAKPTAKPAVAKPKKPAPKAGPVATEADSNLSRREFLNYAWLASIAIFSVGTVGVGLWFAFPNFKAGEFGGEFSIGQAGNILPSANSDPVPYTDGKFWLSNVDTEVDGETRQGVLAIYKVCTHLGCLYEWIPMTFRFECPCHGSKFELSGDYVAGPARRSLDRFVIKAVAPDGTVKETDAEGNPLVVDPEDMLIVDTGQRILGSSDITPA
jgi:cytochrome b6-f complex iron-sulfur subunit